MSYFTDHTRQDAVWKCPRYRFLGWEYAGWGIQSIIPNLDVELGKALHVGTGELAKGIDIINATNMAVVSFLDATNNFFAPALLATYKDLIEGFLIAFSKLWLPKILEKYLVIGVEEEIEAALSEYITMGARPDAILGDKVKGEIGIWSIKSTSKWNDARELENKFDSQGHSEAWITEQNLEGRKVQWVQLFYIITGPREKTPDGEIHQSPVYQGWVQENGISINLAHSYWWKDKEGSRHSLGKNWRRFSVASEYQGGIPQWIDDILAKKIQPEAGNPFDDLFKCPPAHYRSSIDREEWKLSTWHQEDEIRVASARYQDPSNNDDIKDNILCKYFPKHTSSCVYLYTPCCMIPLCHGTAGEIDDPFKHGFKWRDVNHPQEVEKE